MSRLNEANYLGLLSVQFHCYYSVPADLVDLIYPPAPVASEDQTGQRKHAAEPVAVPTKTDASAKASLVRGSFKSTLLIWFALTALLTSLTLGCAFVHVDTHAADLAAKNNALHAELADWKSAAPKFKAKLDYDAATIAALTKENAMLKNGGGQLSPARIEP